MKDVILLIAVVATFVFGYFLMCKIDKFIDKGKDTNEDEEYFKENDSASCVMLTGDLTDEEIAGELKRFRKEHENTRIVLYEAKDEKNSDTP